MSLANYIIICDGRINLRATSKSDSRTVQALVAASNAAAALVTHIDITSDVPLTEADCKPISDLQHYIMDHLLTMQPKEAKAKCDLMFEYLDALEDKFE